ncbi:13463_t:CDS:2, partial [Dentiscutata heterogama]
MKTGNEIDIAILKNNTELDIQSLNKYYRRAWRSLDFDYSKLDQHCDFLKNKFLNNDSFDEKEKTYLLAKLGEYQEKFNLVNQKGKTRKCEDCHKKTYSVQNCEECIRNYLRQKFNTWTSGDKTIDHEIQKAQNKVICSYQIIEWIPYENLEGVEYFTQGGCATIYKAIWKDGCYDTWDYKTKKLVRFGKQLVILKMLKSSDQNNSWFNEALNHFTIDRIAQYLVPCHGLTKDPETGNFMLVLRYMMTNLRNFLLENNSSISWEQRYDILYEIAACLNEIHRRNNVHRDLHSGNILIRHTLALYISDLGFCGPVDKPLNCIYGNLPYIAPEIMCEMPYTTMADIYSLAIIMWEIAAGVPPYMNKKRDINLALAVVKGMRPKIDDKIPREYATLMEQCWDANPKNRPDISTVWKKIRELRMKLIDAKDNGISEENFLEILPNSTQSTKLAKDKNVTRCSSSLYILTNLSEPKNASKVDSMLLELSVPEY